MTKLTGRQQRFIDEYCSNGGNGTRAVKDAGYRVNNDNSAAATASRLLRSVNIRAQIDAFEAKVTEEVKGKVVYTRELALAEYNKAIEIAKERKQAGAYCKAVAGKVRLYGLDKQVIDDKRDDKRPMTVAELRDALEAAEKLEREANVIMMQVNARNG